MRPRTSVVPAGVRIEGSVDGEGDLVVFGHITGPLRLVGLLVVEEGATIRGHVHARAITVRGTLKGNAFGDEVVRVEAGARLVGDVFAPRIKVVRGAQLAGKMHMGDPDAPALDVYDPALHTLTGRPAPSPLAETRVLDLHGDGIPTVSGISAPLRRRPSRSRQDPPEKPTLAPLPTSMPDLRRLRGTFRS
ncbi:MAG: polymer-forming cytoskeletal protein [Myxococcota bacterium]